MTANYPMGDACRDVVASGATFCARSAPSGKPRNEAAYWASGWQRGRAPIAPSARAGADTGLMASGTSACTRVLPTAGEDAPASERPIAIINAWAVARARYLKPSCVTYRQNPLRSCHRGLTAHTEFQQFAPRKIGGSQSSR